MDMTNKAMASGLLVLLLVMIVGFAAPPVFGSEDDDCWVDDRVDYAICFKTERCRSICLGHGYADGRCQWGFPNLAPYCQCLLSDCHS